MYVIRRSDGKYVSKPGSQSSYTNRLENAQKFATKEAADANRCPGNESTVSVDSLL